MRYDYICNDCSEDDKWFVFETSHGMTKKPKVKCPKCEKTNTEKAFLSAPISYTRGNGWLDKSGRRRDMNLWKLTNDDPYKSMRQKGEADDLAQRLRNGGKRKTNPKTFAVSTKITKSKQKK